MTTFARIVDGFTTDVRVHASSAELAACFHPDWLAAHPFVVVPDGTLHGAKDNGNGTFTPPQTSVSTKPPKDTKTLGILTKRRAVSAAKDGDSARAIYLLQKIGD